MRSLRLAGSSGFTMDAADFKKDWGVDMGVPDDMRIELNKDGTMTIEDHVVTLHREQREKLEQLIYDLNNPVLS